MADREAAARETSTRRAQRMAAGRGAESVLGTGPPKVEADLVEERLVSVEGVEVWQEQEFRPGLQVSDHLAEMPDILLRPIPANL
ncbi:hypothetical protein BH10PLA2_BH10PLA2_31310 [soil metagenome]